MGNKSAKSGQSILRNMSVTSPEWFVDVAGKEPRKHDVVSRKLQERLKLYDFPSVGKPGHEPSLDSLICIYIFCLSCFCIRGVSMGLKCGRRRGRFKNGGVGGEGIVMEKGACG